MYRKYLTKTQTMLPQSRHFKIPEKIAPLLPEPSAKSRHCLGKG